ncbi:zinc/iron permease [Methanococcus vannielii SB]|uniref:Zinc/iron permease n=1 Tax=Methanococcus vannielii (strain ATCC 35089 / DSM 1224 / JCM 13029 / OCM 148 / SB) TaxID=406327 RepID=A6UNP6_METVS|nr:ZIP family metal transporter [Methanococcus vannielii]ABR54118.1 zinc/iron permease [Methanococcus vannielii SB]
MSSLENYSPVLLALFATLFTWFMTALGAFMVFFTKEINREFLDTSLGFTAGIMLAASFWSLLSPAIEMSEHLGIFGLILVGIGFLSGGLFLSGLDKIIPHLHRGLSYNEAEGIKTTWHKNRLMLLAVTLHNIPEGLAVGVLFGALSFEFSNSALISAIALTIGMGIQNFPEGLAVSFPLRGEGLSRKKSFYYGQLSAVVEPIFGVIGALMVTFFTQLLPFSLSFAAGAMVFVVIEEIIPECYIHGNIDKATIAAIFGFTLMMILDVALG